MFTSLTKTDRIEMQAQSTDSTRSVFNPLIYWPLLKFYLPVVITYIVPYLAQQAENRSLTSGGGKQVASTLAAFGIAHSLVKFLCMSANFRHVGLVLVQSRRDLKMSLAFCSIITCLTTTLQVVLGASDLGSYYVKELHTVSSRTNTIAKEGLLFLAGYGSLDIVAKLFEGILLGDKHSLIVAVATLVDLALQTGSIVLLLLTRLPQTSPILIPVISLYLGTFTRLTICLAAFFVKTHGVLKPMSEDNLTLLEIFRFWGPLALVAAFHKINRPLINILVARNEPNPDSASMAVAVFSLVHPTARFFYAGLTGLKVVVQPFMKGGNSKGHAYRLRELGMFSAVMCCCSFSVMLLVFYIPGGTEGIMTELMSTTDKMAALCVLPLRIFTFFPFSVSVQAFFSSWLISRKLTGYLAPGSFVRSLAVFGALFIWPQVGVTGAAIGACAMLSGSVVEMLCTLTGSAIAIRKKVAPETIAEDMNDESAITVLSLPSSVATPQGSEENIVYAVNTRRMSRRMSKISEIRIC